jgi:hypothetical protein
MAKRSEGGFTILELLIAITIATAIVAILLSAFTVGRKSVNKGFAHEEKSQRMRILTDRLTWLLRGAYPHIARTPEGNVLYFSGTGDSVGFVTTSVDPYADTLQDSAGLKWVTIFADSEGLKMQEDIYFADVFEDEPRDEYLFDPTVTSIEFEYLDPGEEGTEAEWVESWDPEEQEYLPSAVKIYLTFEHKEEEVEMPPIVVALKTGQVLGERQKPPASP